MRYINLLVFQEIQALLFIHFTDVYEMKYNCSE